MIPRIAPFGSRNARSSVFAQRSQRDRKSTRLNSSHGYISYAVFCLKKKKEMNPYIVQARSAFYIHTDSISSGTKQGTSDEIFLQLYPDEPHFFLICGRPHRVGTVL